MKSVAAYMSSRPHTIAAELSLGAARELMRAYDVRHLPVLRGGALVGAIDDRSLTGEEALDRHTAVTSVMNPSPYVVSPQTSLRVVASDMARRRVDFAIVLDDGEVVGVVTTIDLARALGEVLAEASRDES